MVLGKNPGLEARASDRAGNLGRGTLRVVPGSSANQHASREGKR